MTNFDFSHSAPNSAPECSLTERLTQAEKQRDGLLLALQEMCDAFGNRPYASVTQTTATAKAKGILASHTRAAVPGAAITPAEDAPYSYYVAFAPVPAQVDVRWTHSGLPSAPSFAPPKRWTVVAQSVNNDTGETGVSPTRGAAKIGRGYRGGPPDSGLDEYGYPWPGRDAFVKAAAQADTTSTPAAANAVALFEKFDALRKIPKPGGYRGEPKHTEREALSIALGENRAPAADAVAVHLHRAKNQPESNWWEADAEYTEKLKKSKAAHHYEFRTLYDRAPDQGAAGL